MHMTNKITGRGEWNKLLEISSVQHTVRPSKHVTRWMTKHDRKNLVADDTAY